MTQHDYLSLTVQRRHWDSCLRPNACVVATCTGISSLFTTRCFARALYVLLVSVGVHRVIFPPLSKLLRLFSRLHSISPDHPLALDVCRLFSHARTLATRAPARLDIQYPMLFSLSNPGAGRVSHAGVLEFLAEPGRVYLPHWVSASSWRRPPFLAASALASLPDRDLSCDVFPH